MRCGMIEDLKQIVSDAGKTLLELRTSEVFEGEWIGSQYKAKADILLHNFLVQELHALAPDIPVVSEEDPASLQSIGKGDFFIIDPIDGTASFVHGFPGFVTQVAHVRGGRVEAAAISVPVTGELFWAKRNSGAYLNGKKLQITETTRWDTLIDNYPEPRGIAQTAFLELSFRHYIESGSISLKICRIADQSADIFFKNVLVRQWDVAAPHLILSESGGILREITGRAINYSVPANYPGIVAANSDRNAKRLIAWYSKHIRERNVP
jgi:3'(2'), 5'-bisphosphate nucleotidase